VSLMPDLAGDLQISSQLLRDFREQTINREAWMVTPHGGGFRRVQVGHRRLLANGNMNESPQQHGRASHDSRGNRPGSRPRAFLALKPRARPCGRGAVPRASHASAEARATGRGVTPLGLMPGRKGKAEVRARAMRARGGLQASYRRPPEG
jgi:hypothetical protein